MQQKVEAAGYECISTNANGTAVQQSTDIENLVQQGCDVIVVMNGDTDGLTNAVKEASEKGVHIISVESVSYTHLKGANLAEMTSLGLPVTSSILTIASII